MFNRDAPKVLIVDSDWRYLERRQQIAVPSTANIHTRYCFFEQPGDAEERAIPKYIKRFTSKNDILDYVRENKIDAILACDCATGKALLDTIGDEIPVILHDRVVPVNPPIIVEQPFEEGEEKKEPHVITTREVLTHHITALSPAAEALANTKRVAATIGAESIPALYKLVAPATQVTKVARPKTIVVNLRTDGLEAAPGTLLNVAVGGNPTKSDVTIADWQALKNYIVTHANDVGNVVVNVSNLQHNEIRKIALMISPLALERPVTFVTNAGQNEEMSELFKELGIQTVSDKDALRSHMVAFENEASQRVQAIVDRLKHLKL